jgi:hypothetical protein
MAGMKTAAIVLGIAQSPILMKKFDTTNNKLANNPTFSLNMNFPMRKTKRTQHTTCRKLIENIVANL